MYSRLEMMIGNIKQRITEYEVPSKAEFLLSFQRINTYKNKEKR